MGKAELMKNMLAPPEQSAKEPNPLEKLFSNTAEAQNASSEDYKMIPLALLDDYAGEDPFSEYSEDELRKLSDSIKEVGVLQPLIIRKKENGRYEVLAGRHRRKAALLAGLRTVPCNENNTDDDTAELIVMYTNYHRRKKVLISEKAKVFKKHMEILKRQGYRSDLGECTGLAQTEAPEITGSARTQVDSENFDEGGSARTQVNSDNLDDWCSPRIQVKSRDIVGNIYGVSGTMVTRYIKLLDLVPELLEKIDGEIIPLYVGYEIAFLDEKLQSRINAIIDTEGIVVNTSAQNIINVLRTEHQDKFAVMTDVEIKEVLSGKTPKEKEAIQKIAKPYQSTFNYFKKRFKELDEDVLGKISESDFEEFMNSALESYIEKLQ